ncbi:MAG: type I-U CRISPR-associated protein Cas7 [Acidobacteria bacterium]|nr:type I-U CRISPR-associated protein Cas7 [Acidobacteriota bacterium]
MADKLTPIFEALAGQPRLLIEAELKPVQGDRFQPTGFPDLGAATYKRPDGTPMLLVESAQSMANRMEAVCWDEAEDRIAAPLANLPHVVVDLGGGMTTSSVQEAHRLNSPYIINNEGLGGAIKAEVGDAESGVLDIRKLARAVFSRDAGAVLHGVFLEKVAGRLRLQRLLSSFVEAEGVSTVTSGGVKLDRVDPTGNAAEGYGNVPFSRTEFTARRIVAYFNLDLATMRGYGLGEEANRLLVALALFKLLKILHSGLRLRTACDLEAEAMNVTRPAGLALEGLSLSDAEAALPGLIAACGFGASSVTRISGRIPARKKGKPTKDGKGAETPAEAGAEA